jgi:hypothetical protein
MLRPLLKLSLLLIVLLVLPIFLIRAQPYDDSELRAFLTPPDCPAPCFMGIRPGVTTFGEAIKLLEGHEWVTNIQLELYESDLFNYGTLTWDWRDMTPGYMDRENQSSVTLIWKDSIEQTGDLDTDVFVGTIQIFTHFPLYTVQQFMGEPDSGNAFIMPDNRIGYTISYHLRRSTRSTLVGFTTVLPCPANLLNYWHGRTQMYETIWVGTDRYIPPKEVVKAC